MPATKPSGIKGGRGCHKVEAEAAANDERR